MVKAVVAAAAVLLVILLACNAFIIVPSPRQPPPGSSVMWQEQVTETLFNSDSTSSIGATIAVTVLAAGVGLALSRRKLHTSRRALKLWDPDQAKVSWSEEDFKYYESCKKELGFAGGLIGGESAFGADKPFNFDPLGFSTRSAQFLPWYREAELKHGRVCMLAFVGLVVPEVVRIPGPGACYDPAVKVIDAYDACMGKEGPVGPLVQVWLFIGLFEILASIPKYSGPDPFTSYTTTPWFYQDTSVEKTSLAMYHAPGLTLENAGDYRLGLNFLPSDPAKAKEMKLKELKNGRLAMLALGGALFQAKLTGGGFPWMYAHKDESQEIGIAATVPGRCSMPLAARSDAYSNKAAQTAAAGYKMSKAVPFLPVSPALEGFAGEEDGFDPMGFSLALDIRWLREAELKHARVCMLASLGWITTDLGVRIPGKPFADVSTLEAHDKMTAYGSMSQILLWIFYAEIFGFLAFLNASEGRTDRKPGDFGIRALYPSDEKGQLDMQMRELRNGRLAMLAFSGMVTAGHLSGKTWPFFARQEEQQVASFGQGSMLCGALGSKRKQIASSNVSRAAGPTSSRSMPFLPVPPKLKGWIGEEQEFDPLGFSDLFDIRFLREAELKHGRVCMLATVGFVAQQYITIPGFQPTPNSVNAVSAAPSSAMATLLFLIGYIESESYGGKITMLDMFEGTGRDPGNWGLGAGLLKGKSEEEIKDVKLKELNNGRLAMIALGGMIAHNAVVEGPLFPFIPDGWEGPKRWAALGYIEQQTLAATAYTEMQYFANVDAGIIPKEL